MSDDDRELSRVVKVGVRQALTSAADKLAKDKTQAKLVDEIVEASNDVVEAVNGLGTDCRITVADGKYTFVKKPNDWRVQVLRYGEPWITIEDGHNAVIALMSHAEELQRILDEEEIYQRH